MACRQANGIYDNLSAARDGSDPASPNPLYDSFSTGGSALNFSSLQLLLSASHPNDGGTFTVSLLSDNSTSPGSLIGSSNPKLDSSLSTSLSVVSLTPNILLAADTRYWIELSSIDSSVRWGWSLDTTGVGVATEFFANSFTGPDNNQFGVVANSDGGPYQMQVIGSPTPLLASWIMMLTGLAGFGFLAAYRRRKNGSVALAAA